MNKLLILLVLVILLLVSVYTFSSNSKDSEALSTVDYKTVSALTGDLTVKVSAKGIVEPNFKVEVKSKVSGRILSFPF